jgi:hypothetical protein
MNYLSEAIRKLKPNAEFSYTNDDYSTVEFNVIKGDAPTQAEINEAIEQLKADEEEAKLDKAAKKATAESKLVALGLTADDLKALVL